MRVFNINKILLLTIALLHFIYKAEAQQDAMFTHYAFNTQAVNPAYVGTREALTITSLYRAQWVGFEGAPKTMTLTLHTPILNTHLGTGLSVINDRLGPSNFTGIYGDGAYRVKISNNGTLSFGIKAGIETYQLDYNSLTQIQSNDPSFSGNYKSKMIPNFGGGMYYYTPKWYFGISVPKIMQNALTFNNGLNLSKESRHYFIIAGRVFNIGKNIKWKPTTFVKITSGVPIELDFTNMIIFHDKIEVGAMYRSNDALGALFGINISDQLRIGYAFDWSYGLASGKYNNGSHELMLRYDFIFRNKARIRSPRYF